MHIVNITHTGVTRHRLIKNSDNDEDVPGQKTDRRRAADEQAGTIHTHTHTHTQRGDRERERERERERPFTLCVYICREWGVMRGLTFLNGRHSAGHNDCFDVSGHSCKFNCLVTLQISPAVYPLLIHNYIWLTPSARPAVIRSYPWVLLSCVFELVSKFLSLLCCDDDQDECVHKYPKRNHQQHILYPSSDK